MPIQPRFNPPELYVRKFIEAHPGGATVNEVAAALRVTPQRIQQVEARALRKLAELSVSRNALELSDELGRPEMPDEGYDCPGGYIG